MEGIIINCKVWADIDIPNDMEICRGRSRFYTNLIRRGIHKKGIGTDSKITCDICIPSDN